MRLKVFDISGNHIETIKKFSQDNFSFENYLNSGQSSLSLKIAKRNSLTLWGKFVELHVWEELVYSWIVEREFYNLQWYFSLYIIGMFSLFYRQDHRTRVWDHGGTMNMVYQTALTRYPLYVLGSEIEQWDTYSFTASSNYSTWDQVIREIVEDSWYEFYFGADKIFKFKENLSTTTHVISIWNEIIWWNLWINLKNVVTRTQWINETSWYDTDEIPSDFIEQLWITERTFREDSWWDNSLSLMRKATNALQDPENEWQIVIWTDHFKYQVGDRVTVNNSPIEVNGVKIVKISYSLHQCTLFLENFPSIVKNL